MAIRLLIFWKDASVFNVDSWRIGNDCANFRVLWPSYKWRLHCYGVYTSDILLELLWHEPESKGGASVLQLLMPRLVFPSLDITPPLLSELDYNSRLGATLGLCP